MSSYQQYSSTGTSSPIVDRGAQQISALQMPLTPDDHMEPNMVSEPGSAPGGLHQRSTTTSSEPDTSPDADQRRDVNGLRLERRSTWPRHPVETFGVGETGPKMSHLAMAKMLLRNQRMQRSKRFHYNPMGSGDELLPSINEGDGNLGGVSPGNSDEGEESWWAEIKDIIVGKWVSLLLVFLPVAFISQYRGWNDVYIFWFNFLAMVPLASILGDFTELLADHTNQVIGGLINATFGNAVEVVIAVQALLANEIRVVQASMIGSIFSNLLLVLGSCFLFGGIKYQEQAFNRTSVTANMSLLSLSSMALVLPTPFAEYYDISNERVLSISRAAAVFLMFMYIQLLVFQLRTHSYLIASEDLVEPPVPFMVALVGLVAVTLLIALLSEYLVDSIGGFVEESGISRTFVGLIVLPVVGNAVEHLTAVSVAVKNKMDLAMGVAVGSSTQISLFVIPLTVIVGWIAKVDMTLNFPHFEIILYVLSVVIVQICLSNGKGNWLLGSLLITTYFMVAVGFWFEDVEDFR